MLEGRSVIEILILVFTAVVAVSVVGLFMAVIFVEIRDPAVDTDPLAPC